LASTAIQAGGTTATPCTDGVKFPNITHSSAGVQGSVGSKTVYNAGAFTLLSQL